MNGRYLNSREIRERVLIEGDLTLITPTHLGNGDAEGVADMPLLRDPLTTRPLLTGASIAGALRNYTREMERGFGNDENRKAPKMAEKLFGFISEEDEQQEASVLSWLIVDDSVAEDDIGVELRDGVSIDGETRTAEKGKKFDIELLPAGTQFQLSFELLMPEENGGALLETLVFALQGLQNGDIGLGQRKRRGYGQCEVTSWTVRRFDLHDRKGLINWLRDDQASAQTGKDIATLLLGHPLDVKDDRREQAILEADFDLRGGMLIRSASNNPHAPDAVHLRNYAGETVLPGTSLAGVLRGQARRILNQVAPEVAETMIDSILGPQIDPRSGNQPHGSRLLVQESVIENPLELVQTRVKIDRVTGGALPQHLFSEQPLFGGKVKISLKLRNPKDAEVGLLLLLLKDLWTGELPIGGESSVGRGRLQGLSATLEYQKETWKFTDQEGLLQVSGNRDKLEELVKAIAGWEEVRHV